MKFSLPASGFQTSRSLAGVQPVSALLCSSIQVHLLKLQNGSKLFFLQVIKYFPGKCGLLTVILKDDNCFMVKEWVEKP